MLLIRVDEDLYFLNRFFVAFRDKLCNSEWIRHQ